MTEPMAFTRDQANDMLCPVRDQPCVADRCALFRWTAMQDTESGLALGQCGLSRDPQP